MSCRAVTNGMRRTASWYDFARMCRLRLRSKPRITLIGYADDRIGEVAGRCVKCADIVLTCHLNEEIDDRGGLINGGKCCILGLPEQETIRLACSNYTNYVVEARNSVLTDLTG